MSKGDELRRRFPEDKVLARLSALGLVARFPMLGNVAGKHRSPVRGSSLEFAQYREYVPGDDPRRMDWRMWGRSDRFYIKEFEADTNLRLCLIVDTSGSLAYEANGISKAEVMKKLAATLAYIASRQGDAVGLFGVGERFHTQIQPRRNATHLRVVLDALDALEVGGKTGLDSALHEAAESTRQRALVVVISDLFLEPEVLNRCFRHLRYRRHDVCVFHLLDRSEVAFEFHRPTRFRDLEGDGAILTDPGLVARPYRKAMDDWLGELGKVMRDSAVDYRRVSLHENIEDVLLRFLLGRKPKTKGDRQR